MSATDASTIVTGLDFVSAPTRDRDAAVAFYGGTLGLHRSVHMPERHAAEVETGTVTLSVHDPERTGIGGFWANANALALPVQDVAAARATLEARAVALAVDIFDAGVCHMAFFADPDGNALHRRCSPWMIGGRR